LPRKSFYCALNTPEKYLLGRLTWQRKTFSFVELLQNPSPFRLIDKCVLIFTLSPDPNNFRRLFYKGKKGRLVIKCGDSIFHGLARVVNPFNKHNYCISFEFIGTWVAASSPDPEP
jgi:hypothetical protein